MFLVEDKKFQCDIDLSKQDSSYYVKVAQNHRTRILNKGDRNVKFKGVIFWYNCIEIFIWNLIESVCQDNYFSTAQWIEVKMSQEYSLRSLACTDMELRISKYPQLHYCPSVSYLSLCPSNSFLYHNFWFRIQNLSVKSLKIDGQFQFSTSKLIYM